MIPHVVTYCQRRRDGRWLRLYIPVLPVLLLLLPLLVLAVIAGLVACYIFRINAATALFGVARVVRALPGTQFHVDDGTVAFHVDVS